MRRQSSVKVEAPCATGPRSVQPRRHRSTREAPNNINTSDNLPGKRRLFARESGPGSVAQVQLGSCSSAGRGLRSAQQAVTKPGWMRAGADSHGIPVRSELDPPNSIVERSGAATRRHRIYLLTIQRLETFNDMTAPRTEPRREIAVGGGFGRDATRIRLRVSSTAGIDWKPRG